MYWFLEEVSGIILLCLDKPWTLWTKNGLEISWQGFDERMERMKRMKIGDWCRSNN
jgi:hypothetical protein